MTNYEKITVGNEGRVELHDQLKLTGAEVSINQLPAVRGCLSCTLIRTMRKSTVSLQARAKPFLTVRKSTSQQVTG